MMRTLIGKEISEHWIPTCVLLAFLGFFSLLISAYVWLLEAGSILDGHRLFLSVFAALAALFLTQRLVTREYRAQTQLFLEALPVTRPAMITVKLLLGWSLLTIVSLVNLYWLAFLGSDDEPITLHFLVLLTLRTVGFVSFVYLITFVMSMLGRYKIPLYLAFFITLMVFLNTSGFELSRFGPIGLIWDRMEYENELVPWGQLQITLAACAGLLGLVYALALVREGALAGMLAEKMSQREKLFITACLLGGSGAITLAEKLATPEPFTLYDMHVAEVGRVQVATSTTEELSFYLAEQLEAVCEYLHIDHAPKVWVNDRKDLDVQRYERAELVDHRSLLLRANVEHPKFDRQAFAAFMIHEFLDVYTQGRMKTEAKMWYWDGFGLYWMSLRPEAKTNQPVRLRAAVAFHDQPLTEEHVGQWRQYRRAVGEDLASAAAAVGIAKLVEKCGAEQSQNLLAKVFEGDVGEDLRATWFEMRYSNRRLFSKWAPISYDTFVKGWLEELNAEAQLKANEIEKLPRPSGTVEMLKGQQKTQLHYSVDGTEINNGEQPKPSIALLYVRLKTFEVEPAPHEIQRVDIDEQSPSGDVDELFDRGEVVLATLRIFDQKLGCERISGWKVYRVP